jgi:hypothetical protein
MYAYHDVSFRELNVNKTFLVKNSEAFIMAENTAIIMRAIYVCGALTVYGVSCFIAK